MTDVLFLWLGINRSKARPIALTFVSNWGVLLGDVLAVAFPLAPFGAIASLSSERNAAFKGWRLTVMQVC